MKIFSYLLLFVLLCPLASEAEVWTSVKGEKLHGDFVSYDFDARTITIRRDYDRRVFAIPESELVHADRLKAVALQSPNVRPYWYTDYQELSSRRANLRKRLLFFYRNGGEREAFELFCHKLLLREAFQEFLKRNNFVVCIQEDLPAEFQELIKHENEYHAKQGLPPDKRPRAFYKDDNEPKVGYSKTGRGSVSLMMPNYNDRNPFNAKVRGGAGAGASGSHSGNPFEVEVSKAKPVLDKDWEKKMEYRSLQSIEDSLNSMLKETRVQGR